MRKSDIFVLNSFHEGMPHALIEALAEGVPVVATKIPAVLEILTDKVNGVLVEVDDPEDLKNKIKYLMDSGRASLARMTLAKNGLKLYKEKFTWDAHVRELYNIFDEVASDFIGRGSC